MHIEMTSRKRRAELLGQALDILIEQPQGLAASSVLERISTSGALSEVELSAHQSRPVRRFEEDLWLSTIALAKAGWLQNDRECWRLTDEGKKAYQGSAGAEDFLSKAAARSSKGWISVNFPQAYSFMTRSFDRLSIESKLLRRIGVRELLSRAFGLTPSWEDVLPMQAPQRFVVPEIKLDNTADLLNHLRSTGVTFAQGGHAIYLSPEALGETAFRFIADNYPAEMRVPNPEDC